MLIKAKATTKRKSRFPAVGKPLEELHLNPGGIRSPDLRWHAADLLQLMSQMQIRTQNEAKASNGHDLRCTARNWIAEV